MFQWLMGFCVCIQACVEKYVLKLGLFHYILLVLLVFQSPGVEADTLSPPTWSVQRNQTSDDGYADLEWAGPASEPYEFFKVTESFNDQESTHYTAETAVRAWRVVPGVYSFVLQVCSRNSAGEPECGRSSKQLKLTVTEAITATLLTEGMDDRTVDIESTPGGPDQLHPGHWYDPAKSGHGWSFYWSNALAPENGSAPVSSYELVGIWYTHEAKVAITDADCPSCLPETSVYRPVFIEFRALSIGDGVYSGALFLSRTDGSSFLAGTAEITFDENNTTADISWSVNFKKESLSDSDSLEYLLGSDPASTHNISHYSGVWLRDAGVYLVIEDIGETAEAMSVVFFDDAGDPTWIQAVNNGTPVEDSSDLCLGYLMEGYSPALDKPSDWTANWFQSGCDSTLAADASNRNGRRYYSDLDDGYFWADFTLPGTQFASGTVTIGTNSSPALFYKGVSFHGVRYDGTAGTSCDLSTPTSICEVQLTWYTDGNYPEATVFAHNQSNNTYYKVLTSTQPAMVDFNYQFPDPGVYDFELHMGNSESTTLIARSEIFTVTGVTTNTPPDLIRPASRSDNIGASIELQLVATDPDVDDVLTFTASNLPPGLGLNATSGLISGTPSNVGGYWVIVSAQDSYGYNDSESFVWTITAGADGIPETPPVPASPPDMSPGIASSKVGATVGEFRVDESGSATYSIPILSAPASGGVSPQISLNYSSQAGNGDVGVGWSVGGVSAITLCPQTMEQDGISGSRGVKLDGEDRFCLDGQRLIVDPSSGAYGNNGAQYRTEIDSLARITSYGTAGNGPAWFKVERRDGSVVEYGNSADSSIEARGNTSPATVFVWVQNRFEDTSGNYMLYHYLENSSGAVAYVLDAIDYAGNTRTGTLPGARMEFVYNHRDTASDLTHHYFAGVQMEQRHLLQSIRSQGRLFAGSPLEDLRFYSLEYEQDGVGRNILTSLTECRSASRTICYQPTRFDWLKSESAINTSATVVDGLLPKSTLAGLLMADVSGDGRPDLLYTNSKGKRFYLHVKRATADAGFIEWASNYSLPKKSDGSSPKVFAIDINSDGMQDVVYSKYSKTTKDYSWVVLVSTGTGFLAEAELNPTHRYLLDSPSMESRFRIMDFNGDGLSDILHSHSPPEGANWQLSVLLNSTISGESPGLSAPINVNIDNADLFPENLGDGWKLNSRPPIFNWTPNEFEKTDIPEAKIFDFNADGAVDLLLKVWRNYEKCIENCQLPIAPGGDAKGGKGGDPEPVYESLIASFWVLMESNGQNAFNRHSIVALGRDCVVSAICNDPAYFDLPFSQNVWPVDINADGLTDLAWGETSGNWYLRINTGFEFLPAEFVGQVPDTVTQLARFEDWNGDHYPDLIYPSSILNDNAKWMLYQNHFGRAFASAINTQVLAGNVGGISGSDSVENDSSVFADFDGDGKTDQLLINNNDRGQILSTQIRKGMNVSGSRVVEPANVITKISNGLGLLTKIIYRPMTDSLVYSRMYDSVAANWGQGAPVYDYVAPLFVVSEVSGSAPVYTDVAALNRAEYHYVGAKMQAGGRGLLGFAEVIVYDPQLQIRTNTRYRQDFPFIGLPVETARASSDVISRFDPVSSVASKQPTNWPLLTASSMPPDSINGILLSYKVQQWQQEQSIAGSWILYSDRSLERTYTLESSLESIVFTENTFDTNRNIIASNVNTFAEDGVLFSQRNTDNQWSAPVLPDWNLGSLSSSRVTHGRAGQSDVIRQSAYEYNSSTGLLTKETIEPDNPGLEIATTYSYDLFGNRTSTSVKGVGMQSRATAVGYEPLGRFIVLETDALGQQTRKIGSSSWDLFGNPLEIENIDGVISTNVIDLMGRPFAAYKQTGSWQKTLNYSGTGSNCPAGTVWYSISTSGGGAETQQCFDVAGRNSRKIGKALNGKLIYVDQYYDESGRPARVSEPYFHTDSPSWNESVYDILGRITGILSAGGDDISSNYDEQAVGTCTAPAPRVIITTNALGQQTTEVKNVLGETTESFDNACGQVSFSYDSMGYLSSVTGADDSVVSMIYDGSGRKTALFDPDKGDWQYAYNALGEMTRQLDAKQQAIDFEYDKLGRVNHRRELTAVNSLTDYVYTTVNHESTTYQTTSPGKSQSSIIIYQSGESGSIVQQQDTAFDWLGRVESVSNTIGSQQFYQLTTYDEYGRIFQQFDASGNDHGLRYAYKYGHLSLLKEAREGVSGVVYQNILDMDARGNITEVELGNGVTAYADYDPTNGQLLNLSAYDRLGAELQNVDYLFDVLGNLRSRHDLSTGNSLKETFNYDGLNRLADVELTAPLLGISIPVQTLALSYAANGNIAWKSDVGSYSYGAGSAGPHAVTQAAGVGYTYDGNGNQLSGDGRSITYTVFDMASRLIKGGQETTFSYGIGNARLRREDFVSGTIEKTTLYLGNVEYISERDGSTLFKRYLGGAAIASYYPASAIQQTSYLLKDHIGSIHSVLDDGGLISTRMHFSPFGERQDFDWQTTLNSFLYAPLNDITTRGFTGHEHVDSMGIIHMNGRIYDAKLGRFLQADPFIQAPKNTQSLNRYSYVYNNPLSYTDPSGYFSFSRFIKKWGRLIVAAVVTYFTYGAASGWAAGWLTGTALAGNTVAIGAIAGAISGFVGGAIISGTIKGAVQGAFSGALLGGVAGHYGNTYSVNRVAADSLAGGVSAEIYGQEFRDGVMFAFVVSGLTYLNYRMDLAERSNSANNLDNLNKRGSKLFGHEYSQAGARRTVDPNSLNGQYLPCRSVAGGCQGVTKAGSFDQASNLAGIGYNPEGKIGYIVDSFAGPHDWLRNHVSRSYIQTPNTSFDIIGNSKYFTGIRKYVDQVANFALIPAAAPFSLAALLGTQPYLYSTLQHYYYEN